MLKGASLLELKNETSAFFLFAFSVRLVYLFFVVPVDWIGDSNMEGNRTQGRSFNVKIFVEDYSKARRLLSYTPKMSLEEGLRKHREKIFQGN